MKNLKKLLILLILCIFIISAGAVSATDDLNTTESIINDDMSIDLDTTDQGSPVVDESYQDDIDVVNEEDVEMEDIQSSGESAPLKESNSKILSAGNTIVVTGNKFSDIQSAINSASAGDTIILNGTYLGSESEIQVSKSITITGVGNTILNARKMSGIFKITASGVTLNNLNLYYCNKTTINWTGANGVMSNCTFMNHSVYCINWTGANGVMSNCTFMNNSWVFWNGTGGTILDCYFYKLNFYFYSNSTQFDNCTFESTHCEFYGNNSTINNCIFKTFNSGAYNPLIINNGYNCSISNTTFEDMYSYYTCVEFSGYDVNFINCTFKNLTTYGYYSTVNIRNSSIENCSFKDCYGNYSGIWVSSYSTFIRSNFTNISSNRYGGLYFTYAGRIDYCNFINCSSQDYGSAIRTNGYAVKIYNSIFDNNENSYNKTFIYFEGKNGTVYRCFFGLNYAADSYIDHILYKNSSGTYKAYPNGHYNLEIQDSTNPYEYTLLFTFRGFEIDPIMSDYDVRIQKVKNDGTIISDTIETVHNNVLPLTYTNELSNGYIKVYNANNGSLITSKKVVIDNKTTQIQLNNQSIFPGESLNLTFNVRDEDGFNVSMGTVNILVDGSLIGSSTLVNGEGSIILENLDIGNHTVTANYIGEDIFQSSSNSSIIKVGKKNTFFQYEDMITDVVLVSLDGRTGDYFNFTLVDDNGAPLSNKAVNITLNGIVYEMNTDENGIVSMQINLQYEGNYPITASFSGDNLYFNTSATANIVVNKVPPVLTTSDASYSINDDKVLTATLKTKYGNPIAGKTILFTINGHEYTGTTDSEGVATVTVTEEGGNHQVLVSFAGDEKLLDVTANSNLEVTKGNSQVSLINSTIDVIPGVVQVLLTDENNNPIADKTVYVEISSGIFNAITDESGIANVIITGLTAGTYESAISFAEDNSYYTSELMTNLNVVKSATDLEVSDLIITNHQGILEVLLSSNDLPIQNKMIYVIFNDYTLNSVTNVLGIATFNIGELNLPNKKYTTLVKFEEDDECLASSKIINIFVNNGDDTNIANGVISLDSEDGSSIIVTLKDLENNVIADANVVYSINGGEYETSVTDENGQCIISVADNSTVNVIYTDEDGFNVTASLKTFVVNNTIIEYVPVEVPVTANATIEFVASDNYVTAILKDLDGNALANKVISVTVNGVDSSLITDANGQTNIMVNGNYSIKVVYKDDNDATISATFANNVLEKIVEINNTIIEYVNVTVEVPVSANATIDLVVDDDVLKITLRDLDGNVLANKAVTVSVNGISSSLITDGAGVANVRVNDNDTVKVVYVDVNGASVSASLVNNVVNNTIIEYVNVTEEIPVTANATIDLVVDGEILKISLKDLDGNPLANKVLAVFIKDLNYNLITNADGETSVRVNENDVIKVVYVDVNGASVSASLVNSVVNNTVIEYVNVTVEVPVSANATIDLVVDGEILKISLKDLDGNALANKVVTVSINGISSSLITNAVGETSVRVNDNDTVKVVYVDVNGASVSASLVNSVVNNTIIEYVNVTEEVPVTANATIDLVADGDIVNITLRDLDGNALANKVLSVFVNDMNYNVITNADGKTSVKVNDNDTVKVIFTDINGANATASLVNSVVNNTVIEYVNVTEEVPVTANATIDLVADGNIVNITLRDLDGNALVNKVLAVTIKGVTINLITDAEGKTNIRVNDNETVQVVYKDVNGANATASLVNNVVNNTVIEYVDVPVSANATIDLTLSDSNTVKVTLKDLDGNVLVANISVIVDGVETKNMTDSDGTLLVPVGDNSFVKVVYIDSNGATVSASIKNNVFKPVSKKSTQIIFEDMVTTAVDNKADGKVGEYFIWRLVDQDNVPITNTPMQIGFNGVVYDEKNGIVTDENGYAKLQINLGYKNLYTFAICYLGDENYNGSFVVSKITVNTQTGSLTVPNKSYSASAKTKSLTATFKTAKGNVVANKKVSFTVNGKTYSAKTNDKGVATVKVSLNTKGTYSITAKFAGDSTYSAMSKTAKLTIK